MGQAIVAQSFVIKKKKSGWQPLTKQIIAIPIGRFIKL